MSNEEIAKELLSVLKEKMMYREGLPSDGWAVEMICNALTAAQKSVQLTDGILCKDCGHPVSVTQVAGCLDHPVRN